MQPRETLLRLLVQWRKGAGLNQTSLAARLGITQSEVSKFERGERGLDARRLQAWLQVLGKPSADLVAPGTAPGPFTGTRYSRRR